MKIGVPREIKTHEYRVGMTPHSVKAYVKNGHRVLVEKGAGVGSGYEDAGVQGSGRARSSPTRRSCSASRR